MILQVCPNDHPPFADVLTTYESALRLAGLSVQTIVLQAPTGDPLPNVTYLNEGDVRDARLPELAVPRAVICHRYRASKAVAQSPLSGVPRLVVAHEFGYFARTRRRLSARFERDVTYAGVSPPVVEEMSVGRRKALLLPNVLDVSKLKLADRAAARAELGLPEDARIIGWVGRLHEKKKPLTAIAAMTDAPPGAHLAVLGAGDLEQPMRLAAEGLPVTFCGNVANAKNLYAAFDVLLITSTGAEAFGMTALEALAASVPVVCGATPGPQYVLGDLGVYANSQTPVDIGAALARALEIDSARYAKQAAERVRKKFSVERLSERLSDWLEIAQ